jgi:hypothetical protein
MTSQTKRDFAHAVGGPMEPRGQTCPRLDGDRVERCACGEAGVCDLPTLRTTNMSFSHIRQTRESNAGITVRIGA